MVGVREGDTNCVEAVMNSNGTNEQKVFASQHVEIIRISARTVWSAT